MARPCKWCGQIFSNEEDVRDHERVHRDTDRRTTFEHNGIDSAHYWEFKDSRDDFVSDVTEAEVPGVLDRFETAAVENGRNDSVRTFFQCEICGKPYTAKSSLNQHIKAKHSKEAFACGHCDKTFGFVYSRNRHQRNCRGNDHTCPKCQKRCTTPSGLLRHLNVHNQVPESKRQPLKPDRETRMCTRQIRGKGSSSRTTPSQFRCRRCTEVFANRHELYLHGLRQHYTQEGGALQPRPWGSRDVIPFERDQALREVYEANTPLILEAHRIGPMNSVFNFPLTNEVNMNQLMDFAQDIYQRQQRAFRLNVVFGTILQHRETGRYRYFVPYNNNGIFERPLYISKREDLQRFRRGMQQKDILQELLNQRPDTKWIPVLITNVHFLVYETNYPIGQGFLPAFLNAKVSLYTLENNANTGKAYKDNLCAFRCLALHRGYDVKSIEGPSKEYFGQWTNESIDEFSGLIFEDFPKFESLFEVNLEVYSLQEDGFVKNVYKSRGKYESSMYVNLYENHFSYIRDFAAFGQKFQCKTCERHFRKVSNLHRHQRVCTNKTRLVYPGGFHKTKESITEQLEQYEIYVPEEERTFPWFVCYDFEALLQKVEDCSTESLQWTAKHILVSVSICSNVEGYTDPVCFVNDDQNLLIEAMVNHMEEIAERVYELAEEKWGWVLKAIDDKIREHEDEYLTRIIEDEHEDEHEEQNSDEALEDEREIRTSSHPLEKIYGHMEAFMSQVPVLGFNSAKYDLNLVKRCLAKHLKLHENSSAFVVKKNNAYTCIATESLKFLDMSQFLAPGSSYAGFLKAYRVEEQKGYFPYEWFDDVDKLQMTSLPPHEAFYSQLKGSNITEEEYTFCQNVWKDQRMTTFKDFLMWYNNLDVTGFVLAVEKFQQFYFDKRINVFSSAVSVPGVARQLLFKTAKEAQANFALFDEYNKDLYQTIKSNIVGGPSIIFTRHHCAGKTKIRGGKICGSIIGFDANALYVQCLSKQLPIGPIVRRLSSNDFRPELRDKYMSAYYWMDWIAHTHDKVIQHRLNTGREVRVGRYPVDGYIVPTRPGEKATVLQFQGCYWHGHLCEVTRGTKDEKWHATRVQKYRKTLETTAYLKKDHDVIEIWECQFRKYCNENPRIYEFIDSRRPGFFRDHKGKISDNAILDAVDKETLFGMIEVDIQVPEQWPDYFSHPTLTPYQYFQEMSPLFCTSEIPFEVIGEHMQADIWNHQLSDKPRRLLVGGMRAEQILIATPLLKWYLDHGMIVTKIYQVVEFLSQRCFRDFVMEVTNARRKGDVDPDTGIIADTMKVIGNSGYGSLIMDKTKHREIQYVQGENETCLKVNEPRFRSLDCLDEAEQYYEVEMAKGTIKLDLPIQLGYFILQYAKLRMLEFYYDFIDVYVDRSDFEYCEMDTDSAYLAISGTCLRDVIRPEMRVKYEKGLNGYCSDIEIEADADYHWFPRTCCSAHAKYDKRTPGLFKLEYQGDEMIGLCSKTYIVRKAEIKKPSNSFIVAQRLLHKARGNSSKKRSLFQSRHTHEYKFSSKGVSKRHLRAPMAKFRRVLKSHKAEGGCNRGFRVRKNAVFTYTQERRGFSYLYCKRKVLDDGSTS